MSVGDDGGRWSSYDAMARHLAPAAQRLTDLVTLTEGAVVDLGSGAGLGLQLLERAGVRAVGLERAEDQVRTAQSRGVPQIRGDAATLPFRSASVDAVTSNFAVIFVQPTGAGLAEVARVLRPGGRFAFTAWTPGGWPQPMREVMARHLGVEAPPFPTELGQVDTVRAALGDQALDVADAVAGHLDWQVDGPEHAVEVLTGAAGGLRLLRSRLEDAGGWDAARDELVALVEPRCERLDGSLVVRDAYLLTVATSRR